MSEEENEVALTDDPLCALSYIDPETMEVWFGNNTIGWFKEDSIAGGGVMTLIDVDKLIDYFMERTGYRTGLIILTPEQMELFRVNCSPLLVSANLNGNPCDVIEYRGFSICDKTHEVDIDPSKGMPSFLKIDYETGRVTTIAAGA